MRNTTPPKWAQELTLQALCYLREEGVSLPPPTLEWHQRDRGWSVGCCWTEQARIVIQAGTGDLANKLVLLHEIAHLQDRGHTDEFWNTAWKLYRWAKLPVGYCLKTEGSYKKGALVAYRRMVKARR